ncbi:PAS domain-containing hybrid sensor histidine kinase/response regulator [Desulfocurvibacter africanus]|uniref:PAS domain-containing hybrid sensor histidine kinase/response regulator n=1 Tax=Desulfocurvibacter africanus TaxID=873 RepID=UPI001FCB6559|nr:PAS domain-containing sensor histidine kinase [Desulfocurvibacter africanus]
MTVESSLLSLPEELAVLRALVEHTEVQLAFLAPDFTFRYANEAYVCGCGYSREEIMGRNHFELFPDAENETIFRKVRDTGQAVSFKAKPFVYASQPERGTTYWDWRLAPVAGSDGNLLGLAFSLTDVTERVRTELALRRSEQEAEEASRAKSEFLASMSHELRTPLGGVLGMTELALMSEPSAAVRTYLQMVLRSGQALRDLVNDLLDLSRIEARKLELESVDFDLRAELALALEPLILDARANGLCLCHSVAPAVPAMVRGDSGRLRQVITNLVSNALKFTEQGGITVAVESDTTGAPDLLRFRVTDTGIGIAADQLESVFDTFRQLRDQTGRTRGGMGLGLAICRRLVDLMGGRLWAESEPGKGSCFQFTARLVVSASSRVQPSGSQPAPQGAPSMRVLVAEDNEINRYLAKSLLQERGHSVHTVRTGSEALQALAGERFDLVLMDVRMPGMDGEQATRAIRGNPPPGVDPAVPIVALTACALKGDRERFLGVGMNAYLAKPINIEELDRVLVEVWRQKAGS